MLQSLIDILLELPRQISSGWHHVRQSRLGLQELDQRRRHRFKRLHVWVGLPHQPQDGLEKVGQELPGLAQNPARVGDEQADVDAGYDELGVVEGLEGVQVAFGRDPGGLGIRF